MRYHLKFRNFHEKLLKATEELFSSKPWRGTDDELFEKYSKWVQAAAEAYGIKVPTLTYDSLGWSPGYSAQEATITLNKFSITTLFHNFRRHMQAQEVARETLALTPDSYEDAQGWACSLFYTVRPRLFRKAVRSGGIVDMHPADLVHPNARMELCQHCDENIFSTTGEGDTPEWLHLYTGRSECEVPIVATDEQPIASPA